MKLRYLGHSGISLSVPAAGRTFQIVIDPFLTGNPSTPVTPESLSPDYVLVTHAHGDHWGDTPLLAKAHGATVVGTAEVADYAQAAGLASHGMNIGGSHAFDFGSVRLTPAWHSSSFPDGTYGGMPTGVVVQAAGLRIYHAGDTALFSDMSLVGRRGLDLALLPIGDNYTMGPDDAIEAVKLLEPRYVMPIHYNTFPLLTQDAAEFKRRVRTETDAACLLLQPGGEADLGELLSKAN